MPPVRDQLRFFVDESTLGIGKILAIARRDVIHVGHPLLPEVPYGTLDPDWIPIIASLGLAVISRDRHHRTKPAEVALMREHGLRVFWIAGKRDLSNWDYNVRMVNRWHDVEEKLATRGPGPWFIAINERSLVEAAV